MIIFSGLTLNDRLNIELGLWVMDGQLATNRAFERKIIELKLLEVPNIHST